ncbi:MAG: hypothetical protein GXP31_11745 [Kiritimatiellaeota bacterium]|nr:hypothetical protein [Kiritimatiellota bacterium]
MRRFPRNDLIALVALTVILLPAPAREGADPPAGFRKNAGPDGVTPRVTVEYFYEKGCPVCERITAEILPVLQHEYAGVCRVRKRDTAEEANYVALVRYIEKFGIETNTSAVMVVNGRYVFAGWSRIRDGVVPKVEELLSAGPAPDESVSAAGGPERAGDEQAGEILSRRLRSFTLLGVIGGGLADGINPCAISTLVFFLSLLSVLKIRGRRLIMVGVAFCAASFLTYTALGLGLFEILGVLDRIGALRRPFEVTMAVVLAVLAFLSFRDALRFHRTRDPAAVSLRLPDAIKRRIHRILHRGIESKRLLIGSAFAGIAVTGLEAACTGQVYVPTLVLIVKGAGVEHGRKGLALVYLLLYNTMFILPLVAAFVVTYQGLKTHRLLRWSRRNVVVGKVALGCFFAALAVLLSVLH